MIHEAVGLFVYLRRLTAGAPGGSGVNNPPSMQESHETQPGSLGGETPWRRARQPTPVFLPGEFHGPRSLPGYSPHGHKESDRIEAT